MIILFAIPFITILLLLLPYFLIPESEREPYYLGIQIFMNALMLFITLFGFYFEKALSFFGIFILLNIIISCFLGSIILLIIKLIRTKTVKSLLFFPVILVVLASCFFIFRFNVSERIALHFEFPEMEKQITRYAETRAYDSRIEEYGEYIGLMWYPGILDNYNMIVYDKTDTLDLMVKMENDFPDNQQIQKFKESFRNYHIRRIYKIKDNYYRCFITFG